MVTVMRELCSLREYLSHFFSSASSTLRLHGRNSIYALVLHSQRSVHGAQDTGHPLKQISSLHPFSVYRPAKKKVVSELARHSQRGLRWMSACQCLTLSAVRHVTDVP